LTLAESKRCIDAVNKYKTVFQTGSQQRSSVFGQFRLACELIRSGRIGTVQRITVGVAGPSRWCNLPEEEMEPGLNWDMWLGQAPLRPYSSVLSPRGVHNHFPSWRAYREYSGGGHTDMVFTWPVSRPTAPRALFWIAAQRRGWQVTGQDVSVTSCGKVSQRLGVEVLCGDFLSMEFDRRFDGISMHQVLEHVKDPWSFVEKIHSLLNPGGVFFVATPNIWSLSNRLKYSYERMGLRKSEIGKYFDSSHHLNYFTPKAMNRLLSRADFTIKAARNGHKVRPGQSRLQRFLMRNITERFVPRSTFFVIAQK